MRAVIADLDRTLLRTDKTLSEYTLRTMRTCHSKGIAVIAATARPERSVTQYNKQVGFDALVTMNGARIILPDTVLEHDIPHLTGTRILSALVSIPDVMISIETSDGIYSNTDVPGWGCTRYDGFPGLPTRGMLYKILASSGNGHLYQQIGHMLPEDVYYTIADKSLVQIMSKDATKWNGIRAVLEALHIPQAETAYFGDDHDDIVPVQMCGIGVAVSNAIEAVLNAADYVTGSNDEDGVAHFIEMNLFQPSPGSASHKLLF